MLRRSLISALMAGPFASAFSWAGDWPWFLGPTRDGSFEAQIRPWQGDGLPAAWGMPLGEGFSGPVVADGKVVLFHRQGADHLVELVRAKDGGRVWQCRLPTSYEDPLGRGDGPRATPAIAGGKVFVTTPEAVLVAIDFATGKKIWSVDLAAAYDPPKGFFGYGVSPLVNGGAVLLNVGGNGAGVVAFSVRDGAELWKVSSQQASYASGIVMRLGDRELAVFFTRDGLLALDPVKGTPVHQMRWRSRQNASVNAASPVAIPGGVFLTACYNTGAIALEMRDGELRKVWSGDESLSSHYSTPVYFEGHLYGFHGRQEEGAELRCVDSKTGKVKWAMPGTGCGWLIRSRDRLLVMQENGDLLLLKANPARCEIEAKAKPLNGSARALPAFADNLLICRDSRECKALKLPS